MADNTDSPLGFFPRSVGAKADRYVNPFYGIPYQYLPLNIESQLWWADHFLLRFGFYRAALFRIANYFITNLSIECESSDAKDQYKEIFEQLHWKETLAMSGLNLIAYGNLFLTINQGFDRFLACPVCGKTTLIDRIKRYTFDGKGTFSLKCVDPRCKHKGKHNVVDKPSKDIEKLNTVFWAPREIKIRHEETTNASEYYWDYPPAYVAKVTKPGDRFFSKKTPKVIYDAIFAKKLFSFNPRTFLHLKLPTPAGVKTDGRAVPPSMYMFDDFFMLQVLRRFNEAICFEDINPFRVIAMSTGENSQANPILNQNSDLWKTAVNTMITEHRMDPGAYHTFPFPLAYQQLGGQGKQLAPTEMIQGAMQNILNALNIPQELYTMTMKIEIVSAALRLFENSWSCIPDAYNQVLQHWADVIGKIKGLAPAKVKLLAVTMSDDIERKSIIGQLVSANAIAKSELLGLYDFDFKEQVRKKMQEDKDVKDLQEEEQEKEQMAASQKASIFQGQQQGQPGQPQGVDTNTQGMGPQDTMQKAQEIAQQLYPLDGAGRRTELQKIKASNETLYGAVKAALQELTSQSQSQGVQQSKQQSQQQAPQQ